MGALRAGRLADSILNHTLKNSIAGVATMVELEEESSDIVLAELQNTMR